MHYRAAASGSFQTLTLVAGDRLAVDHAGSRRQSCNRCNDQREAAREVVVLAGNQPQK
jgi:hypothetical protein